MFSWISLRPLFCQHFQIIAKNPKLDKAGVFLLIADKLIAPSQYFTAWSLHNIFLWESK